MTVSEWVVGRPGPRVRDVVERYIGYRTVGAPATHRGLPSGHLTFIVSIHRPIDVVEQSSPAQAPRTYRSVLSGLHAHPALIAHDGTQEGVAIELTPLGARALLGLPARALWDLTLELPEVVGPVGDELWERLQAAAGWPARFAACDDVLGRLTGTETTPVELGACWQALAASHGRLPVGALAREVGYSRQHLTRRFRDEFGLGPKLAARILRFQRANQLMRAAAPAMSLAEVAARCDYADQAHLSRDFAAFAGCPPTQWLRDEDLPDVQDEAPAGV